MAGDTLMTLDAIAQAQAWLDLWRSRLLSAQRPPTQIAGLESPSALPVRTQTGEVSWVEVEGLWPPR